MDCEQVRAAVSARLDSEAAQLPDDVVDVHLAGCEECQRWLATVTTLGRHLKISATGGPVPTLAGQEMAAQLLSTAEDVPQLAQTLHSRTLPLVLSRIALAALAVVFFCWAGVILFGSPWFGSSWGAASSPEAASTVDAAQLSRFMVEAATTRCALGAGLAWAAYRPRTAGAMLPVYLGFWAFSAGFATRDVVMGLLEPSHDLLGLLGGLAVLFLSVVALLMCWLARMHVHTPLRQSWRWLTAQPLSFSPSDLRRYSTYRAGD